MIDLHTHTLFSDGTDSVEELLSNAEKIGIEVLSITDHNSVGAYKYMENINVKEYYSGKLIPGIEINTKVLGIPIEVLGYGIDYKKMDEALPKFCLSASERNMVEAKILVEKCKKNGVVLEENCIEKYDASYFASRFIRDEIIKFEENFKFFEKEDLDDLKVFYRKHMSNPNSILYVEPGNFIPDFEVVVKHIRECGGLVFIPHIFEYRENSHKILEYILNNCEFDGIECFYTTFSDEQSSFLVELCKEKNKFMSGGSDYHGNAKPNVALGFGEGSLKISRDIISAWESNIVN